MRKFLEFSTFQIIRTINFGRFEVSISITANLTLCAAQIFEFLDICDIFKCEILKKIKIVKMTLFEASVISQNVKSYWQENC